MRVCACVTEMPPPPKTPRSPMTPNSQAMTNNVLLDGSISSRKTGKIPNQIMGAGCRVTRRPLDSRLIGDARIKKLVVKRRRDSKN